MVAGINYIPAEAKAPPHEGVLAVVNHAWRFTRCQFVT